jgi:hypothetical protein
VKGRIEQKLLKLLCKVLIKKTLKKNEVMFEHNEDCVRLENDYVLGGNDKTTIIVFRFDI